MTNKQPEYDAIAQDYQEATQRLMRKYAYEPTMIRYLPPVKNRRVLDIACGDGLATRMIKSMEVKEIVGIDISEEMIKRARHFNTQDIQYYVKDAMNESITDLGTFDVVHVSAVLMHLQREELFNAVFTIRELLKPGAWLT